MAERVRVVNIFSGAEGASNLGEAARRLNAHPLDIALYDTETLDSDERTFQDLLGKLDGTSLLVVRFHAGVPYFKKWARLRQAIDRSRIPVMVHSTLPEEVQELMPLFSPGPAAHAQLFSYVELGGVENEIALLLWALRELGGQDVMVPPPHRPRTEGIYHPDRPRDISDEEYLSSLDARRPVVGILFGQGAWLNGDLAAIDLLVRRVERAGGSVIPVFFTSAPSAVTGSIGVRAVVEKYLSGRTGPRAEAVIVNMGFSQLSMSEPGDGSTGPSAHNFLEDLDVPVLQAMTTWRSYDEWAGSSQGLTFFELSVNVVWPEYDGQVITVPIACTERKSDGTRAAVPIEDRVDLVAEMAMNWTRLKRVPVPQRKVAVLMHQNPPRCDQIGGAYGLDAPESVVSLLRSMSEKGYTVDRLPATGQELVEEMLGRVSNDREWLTAEQMLDGAGGSVGASDYSRWFSALPPSLKEGMSRDWGVPPGDLFVADGKLVVPGIVNGNIFIGLQPPRGLLEKAQENYHSTDLTMTHHYLAYYRWLREVFGAHAVVHMGTHGTLEWLPGKAAGLSSACSPDAVLGPLPHLYPYSVGNPGEGVQAKRRSYAAVIDHLIPVMTRADSYDELADLDIELQAYLGARHAGQGEKASALLTGIADRVRSTSLNDDLGLAENITIEELAGEVERIYDYVSEVKDALIKDGLHVLGRVPEGRKMEEMVYAITRLGNGAVPSLREAVAFSTGLDLRSLLDHPSQVHSERGVTNGSLVDQVDRDCVKLIEQMAAAGYSAKLDGSPYCHLLDCEKVSAAAQHICRTVVPGLRRTGEEIDNLVHGLDGGYVPPGPSGCLTRGNAHILPTGRNFYSIDPASVPTPAAWEQGRILADQMIERYVKDNGTYPENIGIVIFATDTMKTGGDDIAYILWLLGLRPTWSAKGGSVTGLEVIPLEELGRPRIDVTMRISGLFRDAFPNLVELLDEGVETVAFLDESEEENKLIKHMRQDLIDALKEGLGHQEAVDRSVMRIFGCPPGAYGGGVSELIESSNWSDRGDLASSYVSWGCHAYGRKHRGEKLPELFARRLGQLDVAVKNHGTRELDLLDIDDDYIYLGGMISAVSTYGGDEPMAVMGDSSDPGRIRTRTVAEEAKFVFRSRVLNPKWLQGLKEHGYRGAQELSLLVDFAFAWDATSDIIEPWMYESLADGFVLDEEVRKWIEDNNPHALRQMAGRLLEAVQRGMWSPDRETVERLQSVYLDMESALEGMTEDDAGEASGPGGTARGPEEGGRR